MSPTIQSGWFNYRTQTGPTYITRTDRDMDLIYPSETDDETFSRLATLTDPSEEGENSSDENENYEKTHFPQVKTAIKSSPLRK